MDEEQLNTVPDSCTMTEPGILGKDSMEQLRGLMSVFIKCCV